MTDKASENSSSKQLVTYFRWVDNNFEVHEDFI